MVHYIRYLKTPQVGEVSKKAFEVSAVAAVTTDLGDAFYSQQLPLMVRLIDATSTAQVLCATEILWHPHSRAVKIHLECNAKYAGRLVHLQLTTRDTIAAVTDRIAPAIVDVWSSSFLIKSKSKAEPIVERRLVLHGKSQVRIWEETGDSIAKHIWDASYGCLPYLSAYFDDSKDCPSSLLQKLVIDQKSKRLRVLEVGAGCGVVGIALASLRKCEVILSDLEDAQDIMQINVDCSTPMPGSSLKRQVLGWGEGLGSLQDTSFDLVLVSDCIYNPDSSILLAQTLQEVSNVNPDVLIFVAFKRRHEADDVFFEAMQESSLRAVEQGTIKLPHILTDYDIDQPQIETFIFTRQTA